LNRVDLTIALETSYNNVYIPIALGATATGDAAEKTGPIVNYVLMTGKADSNTGGFVPVKTFHLMGYN